VKVAEGNEEAPYGVDNADDLVPSSSGAAKYFSEVAERTARAGRRDGPRVDQRGRRDPLHRGDAMHGRASCSSPASSAT
jgi:hypothetical protein